MANTTADKLAKLSDTKAALKSAINGSGNTVGDVFSAYPAAITSGKTAIAQAITNKGVTTAASATFQQMAENIGQIETGGLVLEPLAGGESEACDLIKTGIPVYLLVNNFGLVPIVGAGTGIAYEVYNEHGNFVTITDNIPIIELHDSSIDDIMFIDYSNNLFNYGVDIFAQDNVSVWAFTNS